MKTYDKNIQLKFKTFLQMSLMKAVDYIHLVKKLILKVKNFLDKTTIRFMEHQ